MNARPVAAAGGVVGLAVLGDSLLYAVLPTHHLAFGVPFELVGVLLSANRLVRLVFNSVAGRLYDRFGPASPFVFGAVGATLTTGAMALLPGFWPLLAIRVAWGGCWSLLRLGGYVAVLRWAGERRGSALGLFWTVVRAGMLLGGFVGALLVDATGLSTALLVLTAATAAAVPLALTVPRPSAPAPATPSALPDHPSAVEAASWWRDRRELAVSLSTALLAFSVHGLVVATLGVILVERFGQEVPVGWLLVGVTTLTGALLGAQRAFELVLAPAVGTLADRWGPIPLVRGGLAGSALAAGLLAVAPGPLPLIATVMLLWFAAAVAMVGLDVSAAALAHEGGGAPLLARYSTWVDLGSAGGPVTGYALAAAIGSDVVPIAAAALLVVSALTASSGAAAARASGRLDS